MKTVSVIIPTYNRAQFIGEAIDSVLDQDVTGCDMEILVVDDGSTDNTRDVIGRFKDQITYIPLKNGGAGRARNIGIEAAQGEWISFLDSDDRWLPFKLSLQFKVLERFPGMKVIHSNFYTFQGDKIIIENGLEYWVKTFRAISKVDWSDAYCRNYDSSDLQIYHNGRPFSVYSGNIFAPMLHGSYGSCVTMLIHRSCLTGDVRFREDFPTWEDYWFFCKLAEYNDVLFLDSPTAENRGHSGPRLTTRPNHIDPLKCHLTICNEIFSKSISSNRPPEGSTQAKCKNLYFALMKEYLKNGQLDHAREMRRRLDFMGALEQDLIQRVYYISSFLPFNYMNRLVGLKNKLKAVSNILE